AQAIADAQMAAADLIVMSKSDLATPAQAEAAWAWARSVNGYAHGIAATQGDIDIALLAHATPFNHPALLPAGGGGLFGDIRALREDAPDEAAASDAAGAYLARQRSIHPAGIASFALRFDVPLDRPLFDLFMSTLLRLRGQDLLRVKGIVYFKGESQAQL